jgi:hypothetical protein
MITNINRIGMMYHSAFGKVLPGDCGRRALLVGGVVFVPCIYHKSYALI